MICLSGKIEVRYTDSKINKKIILNNFEKAIYIPPMIWCSQRYYTKNSVLLVFVIGIMKKRLYSQFCEYKKIRENK